MSSHPYYVGGLNQIDSEIMKASKGNLIAKVGGGGVIIVANKGKAAVVKIADGSSVIRSYVVLKLLLQLGWLSKKEIKNTILEEIIRGELKNHVGKIVGKIE